MTQLLSGKPVANKIKDYVKNQFQALKQPAKMMLIQVKGDSAADYYVQNIIRSSKKLGAEVELKELDPQTTTEELLKLVLKANEDPSVDGIMIQEPLPKHIDAQLINSNIDAGKDIDALNPINAGRIMMGINSLTPCTPTAVYATLRYYQIPTSGRHIVIIGRSSVVGKPLANMLLWKTPFADATVSVVHSRSAQLKELCKQADILVAALGKAGFVVPEMISEKAVLIDVGINEKKDAQDKTYFVGDIDFEACKDKALAITPVPGGIGTVTSAILYLNLLKAQRGTQEGNKSIDDFLTSIFVENYDE